MRITTPDALKGLEALPSLRQLRLGLIFLGLLACGGESAPAPAVFKYLGFTVDNVVARAEKLLA